MPQARKTTRARKPAGERRAELTGAVLAMLAEQSPDAITTAAIADRVGLSQAALFRHFPTKDVLWAAVLTEIEGRALAAWQATETGRPATRLRALLMAQLRLIADTPAIPALIFAQGRLAAEPLTRPIHQRIMAGFRQRIETAIAAALPDATDPAADAALLLIGLMQGVVLRWSLSDRRFDLCAEGDRLIALQLRLLGAPLAGEPS